MTTWTFVDVYSVPPAAGGSFGFMVVVAGPTGRYELEVQAEVLLGYRRTQAFCLARLGVLVRHRHCERLTEVAADDVWQRLVSDAMARNADRPVPAHPAEGPAAPPQAPPPPPNPADLN